MATPTPETKKTILIIDDQPFFLTMQQNMLKRHGFQVLAAESGPDGLAQAKQHKPDLILLDIEMPGMDGFEVCEKLKQDEDLQKIPVVILTATHAVKLNEKAFSVGAEATILKSVSRERLLNILRVALDKDKPSR